MTELSQAVSDLIDMRPVVTRQEAGEAHQGGVHVESHPSLLGLLLEDTGISKSGGSSDPGIPVDAFRLELWAQIVDFTREWARLVGTAFWRDHLAESIRVWSERFDALHRVHAVDESAYDERVRWVQAWCSRIEANFDPDETREGKTACPRCGVRKIVSPDPDDPELFAILVNVTKDTVACRNPECGVTWRHIAEWRFETNYVERINAGESIEPEALELLVTRNTPT